MQRRGLAIAITALASLHASARAESLCLPIDGGSARLAEVDASARIAFVQGRLNEDAQRVRIWAWSWATIYTGLVAFNAIRLGQARGRDDVIDSSIATGASAVGLLALAAMPPKVLRDQRRLASLVAKYPPDGDRCVLLAEVEHVLLRDAASEALQRGVLVHAGNFVFNLGLGVLLTAGFGHVQQAMIVSFTGIAIGELQSFTMRSRIAETLADYRAGKLGRRDRDRLAGWTLVPVIGPQQVGLRAGFAF